MLNRLRQMLIKEFIQLFRDPRARFGLIVPSILQILIYGYAATFELHHVRMAVLDQDHSYESRDLLSRFESNGHFQLTSTLTNWHQISDLIDHGKVTLAIQILPGFSELVRKGQTAPVQVILDGTNSNTALIALGYINEIANDYGQEYALSNLQRTAPAIAVHVPSVELARRPWYNPNLESQWFFVPGTIGSILLTSCLTLASFAIVREREVGTLEQVMVSPISRLEFILGKTIPFFLIAVCQMILIMFIGRLWFQVPFRGSYVLLGIGTTVFLLSILGVALLISTVSGTQQQAMIASFFFIMPAITLSGFSFPISSMPPLMQWLTYLDPLRFYLVIIRDSFLKGVEWGVVWSQIGALAIIATVLLGISVQRFHKSLD
ncbi:MAG TPA: ABC transporter permease [Candidatus Binataceae bacterium]|nr:ABC transporter permease [Candidatus Binataceae bacterium]